MIKPVFKPDRDHAHEYEWAEICTVLFLFFINLKRIMPLPSLHEENPK